MKKRFLLSTLAIVCSTAAVGAETKSGEVKYGTNVDAENNEIEVKWCAESKTKCDCPADLSGDPNSGTPKDQCVQMNIPLGRPRYSALSDAIMLQLNELEATSALYSPNGFKVVAGSAVHSISRDKSISGVPKWVQLVSPKGLLSAFVFTNGESVAKCTSGLAGRSAERLAMVDAQGWATASDPAFYDFYPGDGSRWRFGAARSSPDYLQLVEHGTADGRVETNQDIGLEIVRDADGVLRQVMTPGYLADFAVTGQDAYDLSVYPNDSACVAETRTPEGCFQIVAGAAPVIVWKFRNPTPGTYGVLNVTREATGTEPQTWQYTYVEAVRDFTLVHPGGVKVERLERILSDDGTTWMLRRSELDSGGVPYNVQEQHYVKGATSDTLVQTVRDPGGLNLATRYGYYSGGALDRLEKMTVSEDGSWVRFEYDDSRRVTAEVRPWLDAPTNAPDNQCAVTRTGYDLFAPGDFLAYNDQRPRTVVNEICGVEVSRTYHAYPTNALGQAQEITEQAAFPGAPYGHASNPRTVKTYYAATAALPLPGRLATVVYPGGKTETCGYEYGAFNASTFAFTPDPDCGAWRETVTTTFSTNLLPVTSYLLPVPAMRSVRVWDERGREVLNESYVEDGAAFARVGWTRTSYDRNGKLIETAYSDGRVESATWGANCCGKESETSAEGIITVNGYNELKQKVSETKKGMVADGSGDITTLYAYDLENRVLSIAVTNVASGLGYVASRNAYDAVGRATNTVDRLGNATLTAYDTLVTSVHRPNGVTAVSEQYLDGKTKRLIENGVVKQSYAYGVSPDGTRWTLSADGPLPAIAPLTDIADLRRLISGLDFPWSLSVSDPLNHPVAQHKPGFSRTVLVTSNAYDIAGNLLHIERRVSGVESRLLETTLYSYAADGSLYLTALDLNTNGVIDVAGVDRVTGSSTAYEKDAVNGWWQVSRSWVYPEFNSSAAVTTSVQRVQLTGLGAQQGDVGMRVSHSETLDVSGNATVSENFVERTVRRVMQVAILPTSKQSAVDLKVNGLLQKTVSSTAVTNTFGYDLLGRRIAAIDGRGNTAVTAYNLFGQVSYVEDAATNRTSYAYDVLGRRIEVADALGNAMHTAYDTDGRVIAAWGATYPVVYDYDAQGRMTSLYTYRGTNEIGDQSEILNLKSEMDCTRWLYDNPTGLLTNKLYADNEGPSYTYMPDGKLASRLWARGILTSYAYDATGSLVGVNYSDITPDIAYTYNRLGNRLSAISAVSTNLFAYSHQTLDLASETQNGMVINRTTDAFGRSSGVGFGDSYAVAYGYDDLGRFASVSSSVCLVSFGVNYSRLPGTDFITGYTGTSPVSNFEFKVSKTYELHRNLITSVSNHVNHVYPVLISAYDYANDAIGRRVSRRDSGLAFVQSQTNAFGYNQRSEVTSAVMHTNAYGYEYDTIGNRLFSSVNAETNAYAANALNQYTSISAPPREPVYDADGNMTATGGGWHYVWNGENRMICASNDTHVVTYAYDHQGRMVWKTVSLANAPPEKQIAYIWDDFNIMAERAFIENTTNITYNVWGLDLSGTLQGAGGVGGLLAVTTTFPDQPNSLTTYYPSCDANGNITEYISSDGQIAAHREHDAFGNAIAEALPNFSTNEFANFSFTFWWSTKPWCSVTKLNEYEFRKYWPLLGRWMNRDPLEIVGGVNFYAVVRNTPLDMVDFLGLRSIKSMQCIIGVNDDGLMGPNTSKKIKEFQQLLILAGCLSAGQDDGSWGPRTEAAYITCKSKENLTVPIHVTFYCPCKKCCGPQATGKCADTTPFAEGVLAAPSAIPFGSTVKFILDGKEQTKTVHDRGGAIKVEGNFCDIDYGIPDHDRCLGRGQEDIQGAINVKWRDCDKK